jgi:small subunit ribosomal protein S3
MEAGAKGCQVTISGKLTGERHRTVRFKQGHVKYCGETRHEFMWEAQAIAMKKAGMMGIKVQIMDPAAKMPDEIHVVQPADALLRGLIPKKVLEVEVIGGKEVPLGGEPLSDEELKSVLEKAPKEAPKRRSRAKKPAAPADPNAPPPEPKPRRSRAKKAPAAEEAKPAPEASKPAPEEAKPAPEEAKPAAEAAPAEKPADDNPST